MVIAVAVVGGTALASSAVSAHAAGSAASAQEQAAQSQIQLQQQEFGQEQQNEAPWMQAGTQALQQLTAGFANGGQFTQQFNPGTFQSSPEYQGYLFQQTQGNAAINAGAASKGQATNGKLGGVSSATAEALSNYNQGLASTSYQNWYNNAYNQWFQQQQTEIGGLQNIANMGQNAVAGVNQAGQVATAAENQSQAAIGNAKAAGIEGQASAINQGLGTIAGAAGNYSATGNPFITPQIAQSQYYSNLFNGGGSGGGFTPQDIQTASQPGFQQMQQTGLAPATGGYQINVPTGP